MARLPDLMEFAAQHKLKIGTIADLIEYRGRNESLVQRGQEREIETPWGRFRLVAYRDLPSGATHLALTLGNIRIEHETLVRVHEPLSVLDLLDSGKSGHAWGVGEALTQITGVGCGVLVLLNCSQSVEALRAQLDAHFTGQPPARQGRSMDLRTYGIGAQILRDLGVGKMRLMAVPRKMPSMTGFGLEVTGYAPAAAGRERK
jgi:3,4-dihydroxy 2-butanone 4-phosphate synthase/GTP cyclohydrolase II